MASVKIFLLDPASARETAVELPDDVPMRRLMPALVTKMQLPVKDSEGNIIIYRLHRNSSGLTLTDEDTIESSGAKPGERFTLVPERIPKGPKSEWWKPNFESSPEKEVFDAVDLSAPVYIPTKESLAIGLVPADTVYRLEEYRADQMRWEGIMWAFIGAVLGVIVNWVTSEPIIISRTSLIVIAVFVIMVIITMIASRDYKRRAESMKSRILEFRHSSRILNEKD